MNAHLKTTAAAVIGSALLALSAAAQADAAYGTTTRDQRMDSALQDYRSTHSSSTSSMSTSDQKPGRFARAENSVKRGAHRTGEALKSGASKVGSAVSKAGHKTADALRNTGDKIHDKIGD